MRNWGKRPEVAFSLKLDFLSSAGDPTVPIASILVGVSVKKMSIIGENEWR